MLTFASNGVIAKIAYRDLDLTYFLKVKNLKFLYL